MVCSWPTLTAAESEDLNSTVATFFAADFVTDFAVLTGDVFAFADAGPGRRARPVPEFLVGEDHVRPLPLECADVDPDRLEVVGHLHARHDRARGPRVAHFARQDERELLADPLCHPRRSLHFSHFRLLARLLP